MAHINPNRHLVIRNSDEATLHRNRIETGGANTFLGYKHLTLTFDSNSWDDWEDDVWGFFLRAYTPLSANLQSLTIKIQGDKLFTADNYIKPMISYSVAVPAIESSSEDSDGEKKVAPPKRGPGRPKKHTLKDWNASPASTPAPAMLRTVNVPLDEIVPHISEKSIVAELLRLNTPIPIITINGPMHVSFRRRLITSLNPHWQSSPHCVAQCDGMPAPQASAEVIGEWVRLPTDWDVPTSKPTSMPGMTVMPGKLDTSVVGWMAVGYWRVPSEEVEFLEEDDDDDDDDDEDVVKEGEDEEYMGA